MPKRVFFSIFALIITKVLPKMVFFLNFCRYPNQSPTKKDVFSFFILPEPSSFLAKFCLNGGQKREKHLFGRVLVRKGAKIERKKTLCGRALVNIRAKID